MLLAGLPLPEAPEAGNSKFKTPNSKQIQNSKKSNLNLPTDCSTESLGRVLCFEFGILNFEFWFFPSGFGIKARSGVISTSRTPVGWWISK